MDIEIKEAVDGVGNAFEEFKEVHGKKFDGLNDRIENIEMIQNRPFGPGSAAGDCALNDGIGLTPQSYGITSGGDRLPFFAKNQKMSSQRIPEEQSGFLGDFVRNSLGVRSRKNATLERGIATVPSLVSLQIFDAMRAKSRLIEAGAQTLTVEGPTNFVQIASDASISEHVEAVADISESAPVFNGLECDPGTLAALIPLSIELVQDSPNLDAALMMSLSGAFAAKIDALGITKILADPGINKSTVAEDCGSWAGTMSGVGSALAQNMSVPDALICSPADWASRNGQRWDSVATGDGAWLGAPAALTSMLDLPTSSVPTGQAVFGDFARGVVLAIRQEFRLEVIRWGKAASASHLLAAYCRMGYYLMQPKNLYLQKTTI